VWVHWMMDSANAVVELTLGPLECLHLASSQSIGRVCVIDDGYPVAFPVNYRLVADGRGNAIIVLRARSNSMLSLPREYVGFEVDGIDTEHSTGWSVVFRGTLHDASSPDAPDWLLNFDPRPWVGDRDSWVFITPTLITGRRLASAVVQWAFTSAAYL
jgi:uncharacterized protein